MKDDGDNVMLSEFCDTGETRRAGFDASRFVAGAQARKLLRILASSSDGLSNNDLARRSRMSISSVCARMNELRKIDLPDGLGLLIEGCGYCKDAKTGVHNVVWRVNPNYLRGRER